MEPLFIFEAFKMKGMRDHLGIWWKVVQDCVRCGECCLDRDPHWHFAQDEFLGGCKYLAENDDDTYRCALGHARPFSCCGNSPYSGDDYCSVVLEKIENPMELLN